MKKEPIEQVFKRIGARCVYWFNVKYQRVGHLFQDRFRSEPVEDDSYFLTVLRYIHQNPVKAGICKKVEDYKYSSYQEYITKTWLVDTDFVFDMISKKEFIKHNNEINSDKCLDVEEVPKIRVTDGQAKRIIKKVSKCEKLAEFQNLNLKFRDDYIAILKQNGLSIRQISRLTGISKGLV